MIFVFPVFYFQIEYLKCFAGPFLFFFLKIFGCPYLKIKAVKLFAKLFYEFCVLLFQNQTFEMVF